MYKEISAKAEKIKYQFERLVLGRNIAKDLWKDHKTNAGYHIFFYDCEKKTVGKTIGFIDSMNSQIMVIYKIKTTEQIKKSRSI